MWGCDILYSFSPSEYMQINTQINRTFSDNLIGRTTPCSNVIRTQNLKKEKSYFISKSNEASILHPQILKAITGFKDLTLYSCRVKLNQSSLWANCRDEPPLLCQTSAFKALSTWGLRNWCWFETGIENKSLYIQDTEPTASPPSTGWQLHYCDLSRRDPRSPETSEFHTCHF